MTALVRMVCVLAATGFSLVPLTGRCAGTDPATPGGAAEAAMAPGAVGYVAPAGVFVPDSSREQPGDAGIRAHTNYVVRNPLGVAVRSLADLRQPAPEVSPWPVPGASTAEYPASLACIYGMGRFYAGCVPANNASLNSTGGSRAIAVVLAYDNPTALTDLQTFAATFGLPAPRFTKVQATGNGSCKAVPYNAGWALESALDTQWSFAMAPTAQIILVEARSSSYTDLMYAEQVAEQQVDAYGGGSISNSWSSAEWSAESTTWDWVFRANWRAGSPISFFFASGDAGLGPQYPAASPWVVAVGGTTIHRDPVTHAFQSESCWGGSGGGMSAYETYGSSFGSGTGPWTNYQYPLFGQSNRRIPDIAANADPASGAWVRSNGGWYVVGGTSLATPMLAGIVDNAGNRLGVAPSGGGYYTNAEDNLLYAELMTADDYRANFYDVTTGSNGTAAVTGWDACTGIGSPRGRSGK